MRHGAGDFGAEGGIEGATLALAAQGAFLRAGLGQSGRYLTHQRQVVRRCFVTHLAVIFVAGHIQQMMAHLLHPPTVADESARLGGAVLGSTADFDVAADLSATEPADSRPHHFGQWPRQRGEEDVAQDIVGGCPVAQGNELAQPSELRLGEVAHVSEVFAVTEHLARRATSSTSGRGCSSGLMTRGSGKVVRRFPCGQIIMTNCPIHAQALVSDDGKWPAPNKHELQHHVRARFRTRPAHRRPRSLNRATTRAASRISVRLLRSSRWSPFVFPFPTPTSTFTRGPFQYIFSAGRPRPFCWE